jgi:exopolysaccharide biosynthesis protein
MIKLLSTYFLLLIFILISFGQDSLWTQIDNGLHVAEFRAKQELIAGKSLITVIRINPNYYDLVLLTASELGEMNMSVKDWLKSYDLVCAINAGMFQTDFKSNVGYMKNYKHINHKKINSKYFSIAAFNPVDEGSPKIRIFDSDETNIHQIIKSYHTVIQNLRLIKRPGINRWKNQNKKWSEAALGEDQRGNVLFIFSRSPYSMYELNQSLLSLPIEIVCAQHLEGGPEASLYLNHNGIEIKRVGSYETDFNENDDNNKYWSIPNVIGLKKIKYK